MKRKSAVDWTSTEQGKAKYLAARDLAQKQADELGYDYGIERNDLFKEFRVFMLPMKSNRCGHELRCEVVHPTLLEKCKPGHGP